MKNLSLNSFPVVMTFSWSIKVYSFTTSRRTEAENRTHGLQDQTCSGYQTFQKCHSCLSARWSHGSCTLRLVDVFCSKAVCTALFLKTLNVLLWNIPRNVFRVHKSQYRIYYKRIPLPSSTRLLLVSPSTADLCFHLNRSIFHNLFSCYVALGIGGHANFVKKLYSLFDDHTISDDDLLACEKLTVMQPISRKKTVLLLKLRSFI